MLKKLFKITAWVFGTLIFLFVTLLVIANIYKKEIIQKVVAQLNPYLNCEVRLNPNDIEFSILSAFPKAAVQFKNVTIFEPQYIEKKDTLCYAKLIQFEFNWYNLFNKKYDIDKITFQTGQLHLKLLSDGGNNWDIIKKDSSTKKDNADVNFAISLVEAKQLNLNYKDFSNHFSLNNDIDHLNLSGNFYNSDFKIEAEINGMIQDWEINTNHLFKNKKLTTKIIINKEGDKYAFVNGELGIGKMAYIVNGDLTRSDGSWITHSNIEGKHTDIESVLSLLPKNIADKAGNYKSTGKFNFKAKIDGNINDAEQLSINADFNANKISVKESTSNISLVITKFEANYQQEHNKSTIQCKEFATLLNNNPISGNFKIENLKDPSILSHLKAKINLNDLQQFIHIDTLTDLKGYCNADLALLGRWEEIKNNFTSGNNKFEGTAKIDNLYLKFKRADEGMTITSSFITFDNNQITINETPLSFKNNNLSISGRVNNLFGYISKEQSLSITGKILADKLEPEKWIYKDGNNDNKKEKATLIIPRINYDLTANIDLLVYDKFTAKNLSGRISQSAQQINLDQISFETLGGKCLLNGTAKQQSEGFSIMGTSDLTSINITKLFSDLNNFGQQTLQDKNIKGFGTAKIAFLLPYDQYMKSKPEGIKLGADIELSNGELYQFKPLEKLSAFVKLNELQNIKFQNLKCHVDIINKIISVPKTEIKNSAINISINGSHSFDNMVDYHFSLKLSELLAKRAEAQNKAMNEFEQLEIDENDNRELFITMKGPIDKPKISYDRKAVYNKFKNEMAHEKQNIKGILKEEFGLFKKDSTIKITGNKKEDSSKMKVQFGNEPIAKKAKQLEAPKKKDDEDDY
jgi:hypothetical protein